MEAIDEQRVLKQSYLREEIIEAGFDPYSFKIHMESLKEDGANIDNWTLSELQKTVIEFKKKGTISQNYQDFERIPSQEVSIQEKQPQETLANPSDPSEGIEALNIEALPEEETKENLLKAREKGKTISVPVEIDTRKQKPYTEGSLPSEINILKTEVQKGGLFGMGRSHIYYVIRTEPGGWEVKRRFSDFSWLRDLLVKLYPGFLVPTMTKKKAGKGKVEYYTQKKKAYLNTFLRDLIKTPEFINNEYTLSFLKVADKKKFDAKRKEADLLKGPTKVEDHISLDGKARLETNEEQKQFSHYISDYIDGISPIYSNLKKKCKKLLLDLDQVSTTIFDISKFFDALFQLTIETVPKLPDGSKLDPLKDVYVSMNNMMVSWGNTVVKQANYFQENVCYFLKYQSKQVSGFQELLKTRQTSEQEYTKFKLRLEAKKDKLWLASDPTKWELNPNLKTKSTELLQNKIEAYKQMCFKENIMEAEMKKLFGYYSNQIVKEVTKGLELKAYGYRKTLIGLVNETQSNFEEMLKEWKSHREFVLQDNVGRPSLIKTSSILEKKDRVNMTEGEVLDTVTERNEKRNESDSD